MSTNTIRLLAAAICSLALLPTATASADVTVNVNTPFDESTSHDGLCSLREAIAFSKGFASPDCAPGSPAGTTQIVVPAGHYGLNQSLATGVTPGPVAIDGAGSGQQGTVIDAEHNGTVLDVFGQASVRGVTLTGGQTPAGATASAGADGSTGGVGGVGGGLINHGTLTLTDVTISGNATGHGGTSSATGCVLAGAGGDGGRGGGIYNTGTVTVTGATISANATGAGGLGGTSPCKAGNGGDGGNGGGIYNAGSLTMQNATITSNLAGFGAAGGPGAAFGTFGTGAGIEQASGTGTQLTNVTVALNVAAQQGSGLDVTLGPLSLTNSVVGFNGMGSCAGPIADGAHNVGVQPECPGLQADPKLGPLQSNGGPTETMALLPGSPAIDLAPATGASCPATDQRGVSRPQGPACDAGAYELVPPASTTGIAGTGTTPATGGTAPAPRRRPQITHVRQSASRWIEGSALAQISRKLRLPHGTTFRFNLDQAATVTLQFEHGRHKLTAGTLRLAGHRGTNTLRFDGRLARRHKLAPGRYTLVIVATNGSGQRSAPRSLSFTIVRG